MVSQEDRFAIIADYKRGMPIPKIAKLMKLQFVQVERVVKRFQETGGVKDRQRSGRRRTARTPRIREAIRKKIGRNPARSMRKLAKQHGISRRSVERLVEEDLGLYPYKMARGQLLSDRMKAERMEKAKEMRAQVRGGKLQNILFSDEKIFTVEPLRNAQNHRELLPKGSTRNVTIEKSHFPKSIMVWAGISGLGNPKLVFFEVNGKKVTCNAENYRKLVLDGVVKPWAQELPPDTVWTFQQDWAPAHGSKNTLAWFAANQVNVWWKDVWPPHSPDLNPLDFAVWSIMEQKVCSTSHASVDSLKRALKSAWKEITPEVTAGILKNFRKRLNACIAAKGGHFEQNLK